MTTQVLFVQGAGEDVHDRWDDKLAESLRRELGPGYAVRYPRMPHEAEPSYSEWKAQLFDAIDVLPDGAMLVGHSVGGTILLHGLAERRPRPRLGGLFLVAPPFIGDGGWPSSDPNLKPRDDLSAGLPSGVPVFLYHGTADTVVPITHVDLYAKAIPGALIRIREGRDHQLNNDLSDVARDIRSLSSFD